MQNSPTDILPAEVHTADPLSTRVKRPKLYLRIDRLFPDAPPVSRRRMLAVGLLAVAAAGVVLLWRWSGWSGTVPSGTAGGFHGGVPGMTQITERETHPPSHGSAEGEPPETPTEPALPAETGVSEPGETLPAEPPAERESETLPLSPPEHVPEDTAESPVLPETERQETTSATEPVTDPAPEIPPVPDGCYPIASADVSEALRGAGYIHNEGVTLPPSLSVGSPWRADEPAVLIVNTHPYEGFHDGSPWYDPAQGGLAQTDSPNAPDGVVALGVALTRALRDRGVTVIHLRLPAADGESSAELYDRTESMIRYYCRLYPDIGLVLDLRRSAELTEEGGVLRTVGELDGDPCAQLRIRVSGGRASETVSYDLAVALALRERLWDESPTVSRPVLVKSGSGLVGDVADVRVLTLEMGAAGNTYTEAERLVSPLAGALSAILQNNG